ncbi:uncharacterized protein LOC116525433 [Sapajus apella]|uniref:Uncharacterized protein LOC116525433 n=1 Tax=Sapajus apella TaxID=9515 RepID=A0A6J3EW64_SAPAP|nr:uncharacterized protein LOC116525433 [Sapajus apella]
MGPHGYQEDLQREEMEPRLGAGRGGSEEGGDAREGAGRVTNSFTGGRRESPGSLWGNLCREGRKGFRKSAALPPACSPPRPSLAVDCEERRKEGCIKQKEERTPAGRPLTSDSERQRPGGRGVLQINSSEGRRQSRCLGSWLFPLALRAGCRHRFHIKGNGNQAVAILHQAKLRRRVYAESSDRAREAQLGGDDWTLIIWDKKRSIYGTFSEEPLKTHVSECVQMRAAV